MRKKDMLIISHLRKNARETLTALSRRTKIPVSTIFDKIRVQENSIIRKHTALLDFSKLGYKSRAYVILKVNRKDRELLQEHLVMQKNLNSVLKINNGFDFMIEAIGREITEVEEFVESLEDKFDIKSKKIHYILGDLKREEFLSDPDELGHVPYVLG